MKQKNISHLDFSSSKIYFNIAADYASLVTGVVGSETDFDEFSDYFKLIAEIHEFVSFITSVEFEIGGSAYLGHVRSSDLIQRKLGHFNDHFFRFLYDRRFIEAYRYSEQVELFWEQVDHVSSFDKNQTNVCSLSFFNEVIKGIADAGKEADYKKRFDSRKKSVVQNYQSVLLHVSSLFKTYQQLHVVRIDLLTTRFPSSYLTDVEEAHRLLKLFLKDNHRKALFRNVVGYIWKLEYSAVKDAYFHFVLFLEKSDLLLTDFIADKFGKFWVESVTGNHGTYLICKEGFVLYRSSGTGVIQLGADDKLNQLLKSLKYLMMKDFYLLPSIFVKDGKRQKRTYGHSEV